MPPTGQFAGQPSSGVFGAPGSFRTYTGELQLQGKSLGNALSWTIGGYYEKNKPYSTLQADSYISIFSVLDLQGLRYDSSRAVYGEASYTLAEGLTVSGGLRYTKDNRRLVSLTEQNGVCLQPGANAACLRTQSASFHAVTYNVDVSYKISPHTMIYAATRRGYKSGGFNASVLSASGSIFGPEYVRDAEAGLKTDFNLGGIPVRFNADYYRTWYTDIQLVKAIHDDVTGVTVTATQNAGSAIIQGVEVEATIIPAQGFNVQAFYAYTNPYYTTPGLRGTPFYNVPAHKFGVNASSHYDAGSIGVISPSVNFSYQTSSHASYSPSSTDIQPGYALVDANIEWRRVSGTNLTLSAFVTNLTNKVYKQYELNFINVLGYNATVWSPPRMFGFKAHYDF